MNKKLLITVTIIVAVVVIGISIYTVIQKSDEILSNSNVESIKNTESHDTHHASGDTFDLPVTEIINADEDLKDLIEENKVTVVNFFASWCGPCRSETPLLDEYNKNLDDDVALVGVNISDNEKGRNKFLDEFDVDYPIYLFEDEEKALERYKLMMIPTTFFIDQEGNIARVYVGELSNKTLDQYIQFVKEQ
ncbi:thiol:disulfide interchange protein tlpA [Phocicoccus schoeneichii]|uniref:Thiol-disulfide oxidoreductase ResA n=1 Tax=Phocicoccus schoeneichii TaxID=1812261 RepID=A0A6V7R6J9_9BACL|nr:TlpA disulfide reductase family protein [Jeotgalicoccus schoeneichii]GGH51218.1 thiol:disulfide interchange protein tlpA [Jeotgalicoccus schoeneichii]CAD2072674.1 Thiol-disulfide oxidoreductase ResA [Jeotgalicoccus schoeneichii]